jgi:DNA-binding NarL/FixJ family response regulator
MKQAPEPRAKPAVLLADDHAIIIEGLTKVLEPEFEIVAAVSDGRRLVEAARTLQADAIVADISMPRLTGIEAAREIRKTNPDTKIIVLTMHPEASYARAAFEAGCSGFVLKQASASELRLALREVLAGRRYVTPALAGQMDELTSARPSSAAQSLTPRQMEVLRLIAEGRSSREMAAALGVSVKAVQFHKAEIKRRLGVHSTAELTRYAIQHGLAPL